MTLHFLGIGAQKCGTTWMAEMLALHPAVRFPGGKEVHFWDANYERGLPWYQGLMAVQPGFLNGDITPAYAILPPARIAECRHHFRDVSLLYCVRDPIERAWSSARMALRRAEMGLDEASDRWFMDHFHSRGSLARGDYEACLRRWLAHFPQEQLLLVRQEDIARRPRGIMKAVAEHLGLEASFYDSVTEAALHVRVFEGEPAPLKDDLRVELEKIYGPRIQRFEAYADGLAGIKRA